MRRRKDSQTPEELLYGRLKAGERILWKSRAVERGWTYQDTWKLLFGSVLFSLCTAFLLMLPVFLNLCFDARMKSYRPLSWLGIFFSVPMIVCLLVSSLHLMISPWRKQKSRRSTLYVFTDQRLITLIRETPLFSLSSQEFRFHAWPIPRRRRIRTFLHKDGTGNVILEYRKGGSFVMEDLEHPRETADALKKLVNLHYASSSAALASSVEKDQPITPRKCANDIRAREEIQGKKLKPGEQVLWKSRPVERCWTFAATKQILYGAFILIYPLAVTLGIWQRAINFPTKDWFNPIFYFSILGLICGALAAIFSLTYTLNSFAAPWKERKRRRNALFVLTDHRLMTIIDHRIRTYSVRKIKDIRHRLRRNGSGDLILKYGKKRVFKFKDILNVREAVDILKSFRTAQPAPEREN